MGAAAPGQPVPGGDLGRPARGGKVLSPREQDVLWWWVRGLRVVDVAARLGVSAGTVKTHLRAVYEKLGVHGRAGAAAWAGEAARATPGAQGMLTGGSRRADAAVGEEAEAEGARREGHKP